MTKHAMKTELSDKGTVLVMAGGTGGHVFPALATADCLKAMGFSVRWLGTKAGIESDLVPKSGFDISYVTISGLRGKGIAKLIAGPLQILRAFFQSLSIIRQTNPVAVLGMGGFVTGPAGVAAKVLGKPLLIHEQNAVAGMTNRYLAKIANTVVQAFPGAFGGDCLVVGNPIRSGITQLPAPKLRFSERGNQRRVLVIGGSLGAVALNETIPKVLSKVLNKLSSDLSLDIVHQCGKKKMPATVELYKTLQLKADVKPFIDDMACEYAAADIIICRAGALTVSEIAAVGVPSILIPLPIAVDDHQTRNAEFLQNAGAGFVVQQKDLDIDALALQLSELLVDRNVLLSMAEAARTLAKPKAAETVAKKIIEIAQEVPHAA